MTQDAGIFEVMCPLKTLVSFVVSLLLIQASTIFGQGWLTYQNTLGVGKEKFVFRTDPAFPFIPKPGGTLEDYAVFFKLEGSGYSAELWWAMGESQPVEALMPVPGSQVTFRTGALAGLIVGKAKLDIPGTYGGDQVTLQLRAWNNMGDTVSSWESAVNTGVEHGGSILFAHQLSGVNREGFSEVGTGSIAKGLTYTVLPLPEPSTGGLTALSLIALWLRRRSHR